MIHLSNEAQDTIRRLFGQDHASMAYAHAAEKPEVDLRATEPSSNPRSACERAQRLSAKPTTCLANLTSAHSPLDSQTSRKRILAASASAFDSSGESKLNRSTTSPPYRARTDGGGVDGEVDLQKCGRKLSCTDFPIEGKPHMYCIIPSRIFVYRCRPSGGLAVYWGIWKGREGDHWRFRSRALAIEV